MRLKSTEPRTQLLFSLLLNILFMLAVVLTFRIRADMNDDSIIAMFINGSFSESSLYAPYINIVLAAVLRLLYSAVPQIQWLFFLELTLVTLTFTVICFRLIRRLGYKTGLLAALVPLLLIGFWDWVYAGYTKTAGVAAAGGMLLIFMAFEERIAAGGELSPAGRRFTAGGIILCLLGFSLRHNLALPVYALMCALFIPYLLALFGGEDGFTVRKLTALLRAALPFFIMLALAAGLYAADALAWKKDSYAEWSEFNRARTELYDYTSVHMSYSDAPEQYSAAGISEADVEMLNRYCISDGSTFDPEFMRTAAHIISSVMPQRGVTELVRDFFSTLLWGAIHENYFRALALALLLWLLIGRHDKNAVLTALCWCLIFTGLYLYMIASGRFAQQRVDSCLALTGCIVFLQMLRDKPSKRVGAVLICAVIVSAALTLRTAGQNRIFHTSDSFDQLERIEHYKQCVEVLSKDTEHTYICQQFIHEYLLDYPDENPPAGWCDTLIPAFGWSCQHPDVLAAMERRGISDPYIDGVDNESVLWIDNHIDTTLAYIREHYYPDASAESVEPLSSEIGLKIYRLYS